MPKTIRKCRLKINTTRKKRDIPKLKRYNKHTEAYLDTKLDPRSAEILIKVVGDVSFLVDLRDRKSNED